jgi:hypothetical protein
MSVFLLGTTLYPLRTRVPEPCGHLNVSSVFSTTNTSTKFITCQGVGRSLRKLSASEMRMNLVRTGVKDKVLN